MASPLNNPQMLAKKTELDPLFFFLCFSKHISTRSHYFDATRKHTGSATIRSTCSIHKWL